MKKVMCAKCGGKVKMAKGGKVGSKSTKSFIAGIPNGGPTGPNYQGIDTMKKGGLVKKQNGGATKTSINNGAYGKSIDVKNTKTGSKTLVNKGFSVDDRSKVTNYKDVMHVSKDGKTYKTSVVKSGTGKKITNETPEMKFSASSGVNGKSASTTSKKTGTSTLVTTDKKTGDKKVLVVTKDGKSYNKNVKMQKGGLVKKQNGGAKDEPIYTMGPRKVKKNLRGNFVVKEKGMEFDPRTNEMATVKTRRVIPKNIKPGDVRKDVIRKKTIVTKDALDNLKKGGSTFGMLSVKAGIDKNPKPTAADRIAGAKMNKKKIGGVIRKKK